MWTRHAGFSPAATRPSLRNQRAVRRRSGSRSNRRTSSKRGTQPITNEVVQVQIHKDRRMRMLQVISMVTPGASTNAGCYDSLVKIVVAIKQVPSRDSQLRVNTGGHWIQEEDLTWEINEPDAYALEE